MLLHGNRWSFYQPFHEMVQRGLDNTHASISVWYSVICKSVIFYIFLRDYFWSQVGNMSRHTFYTNLIFFVIVCLNFEHGVSGAKVGAFMNHSRKRRRGVDIIWLEVEGSFDPHSQGRQGHPIQGKKGTLTLVEKGTLDVQTSGGILALASTRDFL